jgi:hypothetical protein
MGHFAKPVSNVAKNCASGRRYRSSGQFPLVGEIDGVGQCEDKSQVRFVTRRVPRQHDGEDP